MPFTKGHPFGKRHKKGNKPWNKNKKGIHLSKKSEFKKGFNPFNKGKKGWNNKGTFKKGHMGMRLEKHPAWQGGKSFEPYTTDWTKTLRQSIRERDKYVCQICYEKQSDKVLVVHHIDYNKQNCNPNNLISLHRSCHMKTNFNREYWIRYFQQKNDRPV